MNGSFSLDAIVRRVRTFRDLFGGAVEITDIPVVTAGHWVGRQAATITIHHSDGAITTIKLPEMR